MEIFVEGREYFCDKCGSKFSQVKYVPEKDVLSYRCNCGFEMFLKPLQENVIVEILETDKPLFID